MFQENITQLSPNLIIIRFAFFRKKLNMSNETEFKLFSSTREAFYQTAALGTSSRVMFVTFSETNWFLLLYKH